MITEDYVSFETAKLLKERGFECATLPYYYDKDGDLLFSAWRTDAGKIEFVAPTLQTAMKWLREEHKLHIAILWDCGAYTGKNSFCYHIDRMDNYEDRGYNKIGFNSYKETVESAIKYCLENLI